MSHDNQKGFTLIELMLSMVFVSALLVAIALTVIQISNTYNRGITLKSVNQLGRTLGTEIYRAINEAPSFDPADSGTLVKQKSSYVYGGRLCTGQYSFVWNDGYAINNSGLKSKLNKYSDNSTIVRFAKIYDQDKNYCYDDGHGYPNVDKDDAIELISESEYNLVIHNFDVVMTSSDSRSKQALYKVTFAVGTNDTNALKYSSDKNVTPSCKLAGQVGADPSYCFVSYFNIVARATGTVR